MLREAYMARDHIVAGGEDPWHESCLVEVGLSAVQDLDVFAALMPSAERRYYLDGGERSENGFVTGHTTRTQGDIDSTSTAHADIPVYTTDASGFAGGGYCGELRYYHEYAVDERAPAKSSNYRELDTGLRCPEFFAERLDWRDIRVLWRTDNSVGMSIVNRQGTMALSLAVISGRI